MHIREAVGGTPAQVVSGIVPRERSERSGASMPMRGDISFRGAICMVIPQYPPAYGGAGLQAQQLATTLARMGVLVEVIAQQGGGTEAGTRTEDGVTVHRQPLPPILARLRPLRSGAFILFLVWRLARRRYLVVHVHGAYWYTIAANVIARIRRQPSIVKITQLGSDDAQTVRARRAGP